MCTAIACWQSCVPRQLVCAPLCGVLLLLMTLPGLAQDHVLTATSASGGVGETVVVDVILDNLQPVRALTFGLAHDGNVATLASIAEGAALLPTNSGAGADFLHFETAAANGSGGLFGMVVSTAAPIEDLAPGANQVIASFSYLLIGAPGQSTSVDFTAMLGAPLLDVVVSVAGVSLTPAQNSGLLQIETPPVENLACVVTEPQACTATLTWSNPVAYDQLTVLVDGVAAATTQGNSIDVTLHAGLPVELCVVGTALGVDAPAACCSVDCPGVVASQFVRSDSDGNGVLNLSDPVLTLGYLFLGASAPCLVAMDVNDSGSVNTADAVYHLSFLFIAGPVPPSPYPSCGGDPTADSLTCANQPCP